MKPERFWFFAILVVLPRQLFCLRPRVRTGIFKIVKKHPKIRSCAQKILQKDGYYSGRVHELTGECEVLKGNLSNSKADDEGYAYVKRVSSTKEFITPLSYGTNFNLTFSDLEYRKRRLEVVTDLNWQGNAVMLSDLPFMFYEATFETPRKTFGTSTNSFFDLYILPARGGLQLSTEKRPKKVCNQIIDVSGKRTRISFIFPTNSSVQVTVDNTGLCTLPSPISTQSFKYFIVTDEKVYSVTETYDWD